MSKRRIVILLASVAIVVALWWLRASRNHPVVLSVARIDVRPWAVGASASAKAGTPASSLALGPTSGRTSGLPGKSDDRLVVPQSARAEISRCLSKSPFGALEPATLEALRAAIEGRAPDPAAEPAKLLWQNVHVRRADGRVLRLRVTPDEESAARRVRVFSVDAEGLPEPMALPAELEGEGTNGAWGTGGADEVIGGIVARFRGLGSVVFESRQTSRRLGGEFAVNVTEENGRIAEIQVFLGASSLGCAWKDLESKAPALDCRCL